MPTITQLEYVLAVAKLKHFGKASEHCHVSQPSLSMQIQKAEDELGLQIFDRNKKPIAMTEKGQVVVEQTQKMIQEYQKLLQLSQKENAELKGDFNLAVIPTLSSSLIPLFAKKFSINYPKVQLYINELTTERILEALKTDEIDGALLATPLPDQNLDQTVLFYESFSVYCSKDHPLLNKKKLKVKDLVEHNDLWILSDGHCFKNQVLNFCSIDSELEVLPNIHFQSGSLETLKRLVESASGYTFLPQLNIIDLNSSEKKRVRDFYPPSPSREISIVCRPGHWKKDIINALSQVIQDRLPDLLLKTKTSQFDIIEIV